MLLTHDEILKTIKERISLAFVKLLETSGRDLHLIRNSDDLKTFSKYLWAVKILVEHLHRGLLEHEKANKYVITKKLVEIRPLNPWEQAMKNLGMGGW